MIALDLPGHGHTTKKVANGSLLCQVHVLQNTMDKLGVAEADWVGHSMGGAIALQLAQSRPDLVRSLTLLASAGLGPEINTEYLQGFTTSRNRRELKPHVRQLFADESLVTRQLVADLLKYKRLDGVQESLEALAYQLGDHGAQAEVSRQVIDAVPTLVIWGADDRIIPASHARDLPNQDNVHIFDNTGHMVQMERRLRRKPPDHRLLEHPGLTAGQARRSDRAKTRCCRGSGPPDMLVPLHPLQYVLTLRRFPDLARSEGLRRVGWERRNEGRCGRLPDQKRRGRMALKSPHWLRFRSRGDPHGR